MSNDRASQTLWQQLGSSLPLFAAAMLIASVAYDYSFLLALGLTLDDVPSTLNEHVRSAVAWAPKVAIAFLLYAVVELALRRAEGGRTEAELIATSPSPKFTRTFRRSGDLAVWGGAVLAALFGPFVSTDSGWVFFSFMVLWGSVTFSILSHPRMAESFNSFPKRLLLVSPVFISIVCMQGHGAGAALKRAPDPTWEVSVKSPEDTRPHQVLGLRRFATFAIAVTSEHRIWVIPNEFILSTRTLKPLDINTLNACRWWQVMCPNTTKK